MAERRRPAGTCCPPVQRSPAYRGLRDFDDPKLIPFGTDSDACAGVENAPRPPEVSLPGPVAGFIGRINARVDLRLLEVIAARGRSLLLVGPKDPAFEPERFEALRRRPNVYWAGLKPAAALPGYLRMMDLGLVPYTGSRFNHGSFPLKALEYLAAGRPVLATELPALRQLATDLICVTGPESFADQADRLLSLPRTAEVMTRRQSFAAQHSWARRAADIHHAINTWPAWAAGVAQPAGRHPASPTAAAG